MNKRSFWDYKSKHEDSPLIKQIITLRDELVAAENTMEGAIQRMNQWTSKGELKSRIAYEYFRPKANKLLWTKVIWNNFTTPKHAFILWLAMKEKLLTKDRLHDPQIDQICLLCRAEVETTKHLFFQCSFVQQV